MLHTGGLHELRGLTEQAVELFINAQQQETDEHYKAFLNEQINTLNNALVNSQTSDRYKVAVVGSFKVGKSSFVNVLCDEKGLASVKANPETAAITIFRYSDTAYAEIRMIGKEKWSSMAEPYQNNSDYFDDDSRYGAIYKLEQLGELKDKFSLSLAELEQKYISDSGFIERIECADWKSSKIRADFSKHIKQYMSRENPLHYLVEQLEVYAPISLLKGGIELIDTPGLNDPDRYRVHLTEELVEDVDVILYLTISGASYSQSDKDFIVTQLRKGKIKHLLIVVTKCDETFKNTLRDSADDDETPPTFQEHLMKEEERIRDQIKDTLIELLRSSNITSEQSDFIHKQLDSITISFISSHYYQDNKKVEAGIDELRNKLIVMLAESERITHARQTLLKALNDVSNRTARNFKARLETTTKDFSADNIRGKLHRMSTIFNEKLIFFRQVVEEKIGFLEQFNRSENDFTVAKIEYILLLTENLITNEFQMDDVARHWKTRRHQRWGYLDDMQHVIANHIFIPMANILEKYAKKFQEKLDEIKVELNKLQKNILEIEQSNHLNVTTQSINLAQIFDIRCQDQLNDLNNFVVSQQQRMIAHLDDFVSNEVRNKLETAREEVAQVRGKGTTVQQTEKITLFYNDLKVTLKDELNLFLINGVMKFTSTLENKSRLIYPELKNDIQMVIDDHLKAIEVNLVELNEHQQETLEKYLNDFLATLEKIQQGQSVFAK